MPGKFKVGRSYIKNTEFDPQYKKIDFYIDFEKGAIFSSKDAVESVRREEVGLQPLLKKTRFLKNQKNLTNNEKEKLKKKYPCQN